jgi:RNA polymerase sigma factor (sigma-70 family)
MRTESLWHSSRYLQGFMIDPFLQGDEFLAEFRDGKASALDKVYRHFSTALRHFLLRGFAFKSGGRNLHFSGMGSTADVDDIMQETFRRAFGPRARQTYDGIRPYKNYLFTIARNAVISEMSQRQRQIPVGDAMMTDRTDPSASAIQTFVASQWRAKACVEYASTHGQETRAESLEVYSLVGGFVETLEEEDAGFFRVRFMEVQSQEKTAEKLGWNRARVRKTEDRLREAFTAHLSGSGYLEDRPEMRKVRRKKARADSQVTRAASRRIWQTLRMENRPEFLLDAA